MGCPPYTARTRAPIGRPYVVTASATWIASSRVGASTRARGGLPLPPGVSDCSSGSANAAVLPVPVAAWPTRSRPSSSGGIACAWIGVGSS